MYLGIALCAAATWTGDLIRFVQSRQSTGRRSKYTCAEMVERARAAAAEQALLQERNQLQSLSVELYETNTHCLHCAQCLMHALRVGLLWNTP